MARKILVIDDEALTIRALTAALRPLGHEVIWALNAARGLALMRTESPDVVLLDIMLGAGQASGWDVLREKLLDESIRAIPVVIITGLADDELRRGADFVQNALSGATVVIPKPVDTERLLLVVGRILGDP